MYLPVQTRANHARDAWIMTAFVLYGTLHGVTAGLDDVISRMSATRLRVMNRVASVDSLPLALKAQRKVAY